MVRADAAGAVSAAMAGVAFAASVVAMGVLRASDSVRVDATLAAGVDAGVAPSALTIVGLRASENVRAG